MATVRLSAPPTDPPERVELGHCIFALHEPHPGHEVAFNRYYERDHMYAAAIQAPWTIAGGRWVATRDLRDLRYPADGPFGMPSERGTYLTMFWLQNGKLEEQQRWVSEQTAIQQQQGRVFTDRDVMTATTYDYLGGAFRDDDGVPPEYALDHRYAGVVWTFLEREPSASLEQARDWVLGELPPLLADAPVAMTLSFTPLPKAPWWPKAAPEVPGVGDRVVSAHFLEADPRDCWEPFAALGKHVEAAGLARTLLVAPFIPTNVGTDDYTDQLW